MSEQIEPVFKIETEKSENTSASEEYAYLDRGGFSSEKFKIELRGLPKFYGIAVSTSKNIFVRSFVRIVT